MKTKELILIQLLCVLPFLHGCQDGNSTSAEKSQRLTAQVNDGFSDYWHQGKAEVTSYKLEQARYGEMRDGEAVLIFVTEDFSKSKQVKLDNPAQAGDDAVNVLKLNMTKKFITGIYPYSMMLSVFTPFKTDEAARSLKITATAQEWCGHTFTQLNLRDGHYDAQLYSYFESEGDRQTRLPETLLEDELWTLIRLAPDKIPQGEMQVIPGLLSQRLRHTEIKPEQAVISIGKAGKSLDGTGNAENMQTLTLSYASGERKLVIYFNKQFPYEITGWEETYMDGFGADKKLLTTQAVRKKSLLTDYWNYHEPDDTYLRDSLGLSNCY